jgi:hypothetical protein
MLCWGWRLGFTVLRRGCRVVQVIRQQDRRLTFPPPPKRHFDFSSPLLFPVVTAQTGRFIYSKVVFSEQPVYLQRLIFFLLKGCLHIVWCMQDNFNRFQNKMPFALVVEWNGMEFEWFHWFCGDIVFKLKVWENLYTESCTKFILIFFYSYMAPFYLLKK